MLLSKDSTTSNSFKQKRGVLHPRGPGFQTVASIFGNLARPQTLQSQALRGRSSAGLIPVDLVLGTDTLGSVLWENGHVGLVCGRCLGFMKMAPATLGRPRRKLYCKS